MSTSSSGDEDVPSPAAAVLARRASRKVKPLREESGSDEDAEEPEEWERDDEASFLLGGGGRGRGARFKCSAWPYAASVRLHGIVQSSTGLEVDDDRRKSLGERRAGRAGRWWCALWGRVAQLSSRQCLGARSTARARTARPSGRRSYSSSPRITSTTLASRYERRAVERQRARWHDPVLRRWLGLTPKRPALCLRGLQKVIARECSEETIFCRACGKCRRVAAAYGIADRG